MMKEITNATTPSLQKNYQPLPIKDETLHETSTIWGSLKSAEPSRFSINKKQPPEKITIIPPEENVLLEISKDEKSPNYEAEKYSLPVKSGKHRNDKMRIWLSIISLGSLTAIGGGAYFHHRSMNSHTSTRDPDRFMGTTTPSPVNMEFPLSPLPYSSASIPIENTDPYRAYSPLAPIVNNPSLATDYRLDKLSDNQLAEVKEYLLSFISAPSRGKRSASDSVLASNILDEVFTQKRISTRYRPSIKAVVLAELNELQDTDPQKIDMSDQRNLVMSMDALLLVLGKKSGEHQKSIQRMAYCIRNRLMKYRGDDNIDAYITMTPIDFTPSLQKAQAQAYLDSLHQDASIIALDHLSYAHHGDGFFDKMIKSTYEKEFKIFTLNAPPPPLDDLIAIEFKDTMMNGGSVPFTKNFTVRELYQGEHKRFAMTKSQKSYYFPRDMDLFVRLALLAPKNMTDVLKEKLDQHYTALSKNEEIKASYKNAVNFRIKGIINQAIANDKTLKNDKSFTSYNMGFQQPKLITLHGNVIPNLVGLYNAKKGKTSVTYISLLTSQVKNFNETQSNDEKEFIRQHISLFEKQQADETNLEPAFKCHLMSIKTRKRFEKECRTFNIKTTTHYATELYQAWLRNIEKNIDSLLYTDHEFNDDFNLQRDKDIYRMVNIVLLPFAMAANSPLAIGIIGSLSLASGSAEVITNYSIAATTDHGGIYENALQEAEIGATFTALGVMADVKLLRTVKVKNAKAQKPNKAFRFKFRYQNNVANLSETLKNKITPNMIDLNVNPERLSQPDLMGIQRTPEGAMFIKYNNAYIKISQTSDDLFQLGNDSAFITIRHYHRRFIPIETGTSVVEPLSQAGPSHSLPRPAATSQHVAISPPEVGQHHETVLPAWPPAPRQQPPRSPTLYRGGQVSPIWPPAELQQPRAAPPQQPGHLQALWPPLSDPNPPAVVPWRQGPLSPVRPPISHPEGPIGLSAQRLPSQPTLAHPIPPAAAPWRQGQPSPVRPPIPHPEEPVDLSAQRLPSQPTLAHPIPPAAAPWRQGQPSPVRPPISHPEEPVDLRVQRLPSQPTLAHPVPPSAAPWRQGQPSPVQPPISHPEEPVDLRVQRLPSQPTLAHPVPPAAAPWRPWRQGQPSPVGPPISHPEGPVDLSVQGRPSQSARPHPIPPATAPWRPWHQEQLSPVRPLVPHPEEPVDLSIPGRAPQSRNLRGNRPLPEPPGPYHCAPTDTLPGQPLPRKGKASESISPGYHYATSPEFTRIDLAGIDDHVIVGYRTLADDNYVHFFTRTTDSTQSGSNTLVISAHGGYLASDVHAAKVVLPPEVTIKLLTPHNTRLQDPGLGTVVNADKHVKAYLTLREGKSEVAFIPQHHQQWFAGKRYHAHDVENTLGEPSGLQNYRHLQFPSETPQDIGKVLLENRQLAAEGKATKTDILVMNDKITSLSETDLEKASLQAVINLDQEGKLLNAQGERYREIVFSHCRGRLDLDAQADSRISTYVMEYPRPTTLPASARTLLISKTVLQRSSLLSPFTVQHEDAGEVAIYPENKHPPLEG